MPSHFELQCFQFLLVAVDGCFEHLAKLYHPLLQALSLIAGHFQLLVMLSTCSPEFIVLGLEFLPNSKQIPVFLASKLHLILQL
jgi:hypothetical protein